MTTNLRQSVEGYFDKVTLTLAKDYKSHPYYLDIVKEAKAIHAHVDMLAMMVEVTGSPQDKEDFTWDMNNHETIPELIEAMREKVELDAFEKGLH